MNTKLLPRTLWPLSLLAALQALPRLPAQTAPAADSSDSAEAKSEPVQMSAFEIRTTKDQGYVLNNSASALKVAQPLLDIPQNVLVVTNDMINDIGFDNASDTLAFVGVNHSFQGNTTAIRGQSVGYPYIDGMPDHGEWEDPINIDSYEVIEGPAEVLYSGAPLSGLVTKTTKKPLPVQQDSLTAVISQFGGYRTWFDSTGPIGQLGEGKFSYRLIGLLEDGNQYFHNMENKREVLHPTLEWDYKTITAIVAYDLEKFTVMDGGEDFILPNGKMYNGPGWDRNNDGLAPNSAEDNSHYGGRAYIIDRVSDNWQMEISAKYFRSIRYGTGIFPDAIDLQNNTIEYYTRSENIPYDYWTVQGDFLGRYYLGPLKNQSSFGFNDSDLQVKDLIWTTSPYTEQTVPLTEAGVDTLIVPSLRGGGFPVPANAGTRQETYPANIYYQHQLDIIPKWLSLVGGYTYSHVETVKDTNVSKSTPYTATDTSATQWLHRYGAVLYLGKDAALYALESESYTPQSQYNLEDGSPVPNTLGKSDEVGFKTAFFNGRLSSSVSVFKMSLSNQAVVSNVPAANGIPYFIPIGTTTDRGWDGNISVQITRGWQAVATFFNGRVVNSSGQPVAFTYENEWSLFTRYNFPRDGAFKGLSLGGGVNRIGGYWNPLGGLTLQDGTSPSYMIKQWVPTPVDAFIAYAFAKHFEARVNGNNLLNQDYVAGNGGGEGALDRSLPINFSFSLSYRF